MKETGNAKYDGVVHDLTGTTPATASQMFGMPCLKVGGKAFAGLWKDGMVFKLSGDAHARAMAVPGAELFDPGMGRPMKEWVAVPPDQSETWEGLARDAMDYVAQKAAAK